MDAAFEQWARAEIARLRADAARATAEADGLQRALDKFSASQQKQRTGKSNGHAAPRAGAVQNSAGLTRMAFMLDRLQGAGTAGLARDDLFRALESQFGTTKGRFRALLYDAREHGRIEQRDGRIFSKGSQ